MSLSPYDESSRPPARTRGQRRRHQIAQAAAALVREEGPAALSHRQVAQRAQCSLSATTYYFSGLDDLRAAAYEVVVEEWAERAVAARAELDATRPEPPDPALELVNVALPPGDVEQLCGFLETIVGAGRLPKAAACVAQARREILLTLRAYLDAYSHHHDWSAEVVLALIDGAACDALSEGTDPRTHAAELVGNALGFGGIDGSRSANPVVSDRL